MAPNALDYFVIKNTISLYCIALDTKNFDILEDVFTNDVHGDYPFDHELQGVEAVANAIKTRLAPVTSQHALTTQIIEVDDFGKSATATTYFNGIHFGKGRWYGKELTAYGKYIDKLALVEGELGIPGASGQWRISKRKVLFMGRVGEERVMEGE